MNEIIFLLPTFGLFGYLIFEILRRPYYLFRKKWKEEFESWLGEEWCWVCDKDLKQHNIITIFRCRQRVIMGLRP